MIGLIVKFVVKWPERWRTGSLPLPFSLSLTLWKREGGGEEGGIGRNIKKGYQISITKGHTL